MKGNQNETIENKRKTWRRTKERKKQNRTSKETNVRKGQTCDGKQRKGKARKERMGSCT